MIKADRWTGAFLFLFSLYVCFESVRLGLGTYYRPGAGFFPFYAGALLGILALILILRAIFGSVETAEPWGNCLDIVAVCLAMLSFALALNLLGFFITAFFFISFLLKVVERRRWLFSLASAFLTAGACYAIFEVWLRAQLPAGILGR